MKGSKPNTLIPDDFDYQYEQFKKSRIKAISLTKEGLIAWAICKDLGLNISRYLEDCIKKAAVALAKKNHENN